jgi:hypothetical protein
MQPFEQPEQSKAESFEITAEQILEFLAGEPDWPKLELTTEHVELATLKKSPLRIWNIEPIDEEHVERLTRSIQKFEFWGGVLVRRTETGELQIVDGHARVAAAIKAGVIEADVTVAHNMDDHRMVCTAAHANLIGRGFDAGVQFTTITGALRSVVRQLRDGTHPNRAWVRRFAKTGSVPPRAILEKLDGLTGWTERDVREWVKTLKAAGYYDPIIRGEPLDGDDTSDSTDDQEETP